MMILPFLLDSERSAGVPALINICNKENYDTHRWECQIELSDPTFGVTASTFGMDAETVDRDSSVYKACADLVCGILTKAGFTEEQAAAAFENRIEFEKELLKLTREAEKELKDIMGQDAHPSAYIDINATFQQFDEFLTAFDIQEGDGVYLAPENRVTIW